MYFLKSSWQMGSRTIPHEDNSPPDKNKAQPLPTRTTIHRTIPHQDNSPLGPLPRNKTTHQDQNLYGGELSSWGVVRIRGKWFDANSRGHTAYQGGISSSVLSVFFTDKFALSQSDARISVAYNSCQWKTLTKRLMKCPPGLCGWLCLPQNF